MAYLGKIGGPRLSEVLVRIKNDLFGKSIEVIQEWYDEIKENFEEILEHEKKTETKNYVTAVIFGGSKMYFEITFRDRPGSFYICATIEYRPTDEELKLLGENYSKKAGHASLTEYERRVDNKEMPSYIVIMHPSEPGFQDTTTIKWDGSKWTRLEYFVCDENLAPPGDFTHEHKMKRAHYYILLAEYGLTLEDVDAEKLPRTSPSELAIIAKNKLSMKKTPNSV